MLYFRTPEAHANAQRQPSVIHDDLQEDRFGALQLTQPDITATLQLLLSAQLALQVLATPALYP